MIYKENTSFSPKLKSTSFPPIFDLIYGLFTIECRKMSTTQIINR